MGATSSSSDDAQSLRVLNSIARQTQGLGNDTRPRYDWRRAPSKTPTRYLLLKPTLPSIDILWRDYGLHAFGLNSISEIVLPPTDQDSWALPLPSYLILLCTSAAAASELKAFLADKKSNVPGSSDLSVTFLAPKDLLASSMLHPVLLSQDCILSFMLELGRPVQDELELDLTLLTAPSAEPSSAAMSLSIFTDETCTPQRDSSQFWFNRASNRIYDTQELYHPRRSGGPHDEDRSGFQLEGYMSLNSPPRGTTGVPVSTDAGAGADRASITPRASLQDYLSSSNPAKPLNRDVKRVRPLCLGASLSPAIPSHLSQLRVSFEGRSEEGSLPYWGGGGSLQLAMGHSLAACHISSASSSSDFQASKTLGVGTSPREKKSSSITLSRPRMRMMACVEEDLSTSARI